MRPAASNSSNALATDDWLGIVTIRIQRSKTRSMLTLLNDCDPIDRRSPLAFRPSTSIDSIGVFWVYPQWTSLIGFVLRQKFTHKNLVKLLGWSGLSLDQEGPYGTRSNGTAVGIVRGIRGF
jgi:hypothetical protein